MGSIADKLRNILKCKADIAAAISSKNVPCSKDDALSSYAEKINAIDIIEPSEPKVGDIRKDGIVVYVDPADPKRFLLMSKDEFNLAWSTIGDTTEISGLTLEDGRANCEIIYNLPEYKSDPNSFPIFKAAKEYKDGNWFVPSLYEFDHVYEYLLDWKRGNKLSWPDSMPMPNYDKAEEILNGWEMNGLIPIDFSSTYGLYWVSSQWEIKPNFWGQADSESTFEGNSITGADPSTIHMARLFKWVEPEKIVKSYGGYIKDPNWPDFTKEIAEDTEEYANKLFIVVNDSTKTFAFPYNVDLAVTSDSASVPSPYGTVHQWDRTKDLKDSKGNIIRWVKLYSKSKSIMLAMDGIVYACANYEPGFGTDSASSLECYELTVPMKNIQFDGPALKCIIAPNIDDEGHIILTGVNATDTTYYKWKYPSGLIFTGADEILLCTHPKNMLCFDYIEYDYNRIPSELTESLYVTTGVIGSSAVMQETSGYLFNNCKYLKHVIIKSLDVTVQNALANSNQLNAIVTLTIPDGWSGNITVKSPWLTVSSLLGIINALADKTGGAAGVLSIGATNMAKLSDEEKLIATNKNWTIS